MKKSIIAYVLFLLILLFVPTFLDENKEYLLDRFVLGFLSFLPVVGVGLLLGYMDKVSLGHTGFWAIGAYGSVLLTNHFPMISPFWALCLMMLVNGALAWLLGSIIFRLKGPYFALGTFAFAMLILEFINKQTELTGGAGGLYEIESFRFFMTFETVQHYYYFALSSAVFFFLLTRLIFRHRWGITLNALKMSEPDMVALGYNPAFYHKWTFVYSAILTSFSGSLYAHFTAYINPVLFSVHEGVNFLSMAIIGGVQSFAGPVIGTVFFQCLTEFLNEMRDRYEFLSQLDQLQFIFSSLILILTVVFLPNGLSSLGDKLTRWVKRRF